MTKLLLVIAAIALVASGCGGDDAARAPAGETETVSSGAVPFDQAFVDAMVPHHREAIDMAKVAHPRLTAGVPRL